LSYTIIGYNQGHECAFYGEMIGPIQTHALLPDSPAIDVIPAAIDGCGEAKSIDQRGLARLQGAGCDIGAYEVQHESSPSEDLTQAAVGSGEGEGQGRRASFIWILIRAALVVFRGRLG
jgi:hypothetical protein